MDTNSRNKIKFAFIPATVVLYYLAGEYFFRVLPRIESNQYMEFGWDHFFQTILYLFLLILLAFITEWAVFSGTIKNKGPQIIIEEQEEEGHHPISVVTTKPVVEKIDIQPAKKKRKK